MYACTYGVQGGVAIAKRREVALLAGVSEATVSRVLSGTGPIKEETRRKVMEAAEKLHYYPNAIARNFARRRSGHIGVVLPYVPKVHLFSTYYFSEILSGVGEALRSFGYDVLLLFREPEEEYDYAMLYKTQKVDACIVLGARGQEQEREKLRELEVEGFPFCLVNQEFAGASFSNVDAMHVEGSLLAMNHLVEQGCRHIAFINGPIHYSNSLERAEGYRLAHELHGLAYHEGMSYEGNYSRTSGYALAGRLLEDIRRGRIDAVFAGNDRMAIGLCQGLKEHGCVAGQDYALVGYDDSDSARLCDPPLTSVHVPFYEMGHRAAEIVVEQLEMDQQVFKASTERLATQLKIRASSRYTR